MKTTLMTTALIGLLLLVGAPAALAETAAQSDAPLVPTPDGSGPWVPYVAAAALVMGMAFLARRRMGRTATPAEIALQRLDRARSLLRPERALEFSMEVSTAVENYIREQMDIEAVPPSPEFIRRLNERLNGQENLLREFLKLCDMAKQAGWDLDIALMEAMRDVARRFIIETSLAAADNGGDS